MSSFNKFIGMGNLTRDPGLQYTSGGTAVCTLNLAMNHNYTSNGEKKEDVCFVEVTVWGKQGENCNEYLTKGRQVLVEGRLQLQTWEADGQKRSKHVVVADNVKFLSAGQKNNSGQQNNYNNGDDSGNIPF